MYCLKLSSDDFHKSIDLHFIRSNYNFYTKYIDLYESIICINFLSKDGETYYDDNNFFNEESPSYDYFVEGVVIGVFFEDEETALYYKLKYFT